MDESNATSLCEAVENGKDHTISANLQTNLQQLNECHGEDLANLTGTNLLEEIHICEKDIGKDEDSNEPKQAEYSEDEDKTQIECNDQHNNPVDDKLDKENDSLGNATSAISKYTNVENIMETEDIVLIYEDYSDSNFEELLPGDEDEPANSLNTDNNKEGKKYGEKYNESRDKGPMSEVLSADQDITVESVNTDQNMEEHIEDEANEEKDDEAEEEHPTSEERLSDDKDEIDDSLNTGQNNEEQMEDDKKDDEAGDTGQISEELLLGDKDEIDDSLNTDHNMEDEDNEEKDDEAEDKSQASEELLSEDKDEIDDLLNTELNKEEQMEDEAGDKDQISKEHLLREKDEIDYSLNTDYNIEDEDNEEKNDEAEDKSQTSEELLSEDKDEINDSLNTNQNNEEQIEDDEAKDEAGDEDQIFEELLLGDKDEIDDSLNTDHNIEDEHNEENDYEAGDKSQTSEQLLSKDKDEINDSLNTNQNNEEQMEDEEKDDEASDKDQISEELILGDKDESDDSLNTDHNIEDGDNDEKDDEAEDKSQTFEELLLANNDELDDLLTTELSNEEHMKDEDHEEKDDETRGESPSSVELLLADIYKVDDSLNMDELIKDKNSDKKDDEVIDFDFTCNSNFSKVVLIGNMEVDVFKRINSDFVTVLPEPDLPLEKLKSYIESKKSSMPPDTLWVAFPGVQNIGDLTNLPLCDLESCSKPFKKLTFKASLGGKLYVESSKLMLSIIQSIKEVLNSTSDFTIMPPLPLTIVSECLFKHSVMHECVNQETFVVESDDLIHIKKSYKCLSIVLCDILRKRVDCQNLSTKSFFEVYDNTVNVHILSCQLKREKFFPLQKAVINFISNTGKLKIPIVSFPKDITINQGSENKLNPISEVSEKFVFISFNTQFKFMYDSSKVNSSPIHIYLTVPPDYYNLSKSLAKLKGEYEKMCFIILADISMAYEHHFMPCHTTSTTCPISMLSSDVLEVEQSISFVEKVKQRIKEHFYHSEIIVAPLYPRVLFLSASSVEHKEMHSISFHLSKPLLLRNSVDETKSSTTQFDIIWREKFSLPINENSETNIFVQTFNELQKECLLGHFKELKATWKKDLENMKVLPGMLDFIGGVPKMYSFSILSSQSSVVQPKTNTSVNSHKVSTSMPVSTQGSHDMQPYHQALTNMPPNYPYSGHASTYLPNPQRPMYMQPQAPAYMPPQSQAYMPSQAPMFMQPQAPRHMQPPPSMYRQHPPQMCMPHPVQKDVPAYGQGGLPPSYQGASMNKTPAQSTVSPSQSLQSYSKQASKSSASGHSNQSLADYVKAYVNEQNRTVVTQDIPQTMKDSKDVKYDVVHGESSDTPWTANKILLAGTSWTNHLLQKTQLQLPHVELILKKNAKLADLIVQIEESLRVHGRNSDVLMIVGLFGDLVSCKWQEGNPKLYFDDGVNLDCIVKLILLCNLRWKKKFAHLSIIWAFPPVPDFTLFNGRSSDREYGKFHRALTSLKNMLTAKLPAILIFEFNKVLFHESSYDKCITMLEHSNRPYVNKMMTEDGFLPAEKFANKFWTILKTFISSCQETFVIELMKVPDAIPILFLKDFITLVDGGAQMEDKGNGTYEISVSKRVSAELLVHELNRCNIADSKFEAILYGSSDPKGNLSQPQKHMVHQLYLKVYHTWKPLIVRSINDHFSKETSKTQNISSEKKNWTGVSNKQDTDKGKMSKKRELEERKDSVSAKKFHTGSKEESSRKLSDTSKELKSRKRELQDRLDSIASKKLNTGPKKGQSFQDLDEPAEELRSNKRDFQRILDTFSTETSSTGTRKVESLHKFGENSKEPKGKKRELQGNLDSISSRMLSTDTKKDESFQKFGETSKQPKGKASLLSKEFLHERQDLLQEHNKEFKVFEELPEIHPEFEEHYQLFSDEYKKTHPFDTDEQEKEEKWMMYWKSMLYSLKASEWKSKSFSLQKKFGLNLSENKPKDSPQDRPPSASSNPDVEVEKPKDLLSTFNVKDTLQILNELKDRLGPVGPAVNVIVSTILKSGSDTPEALQIIADPENKLIFNMVLNKLESLKAIHPEAAATFTLIINWTSQMIALATKATQSPKEPSINIEAIAQASYGKGNDLTINLIKSALFYGGVTEPSNDEVNKIFLEVCKLHFEREMN